MVSLSDSLRERPVVYVTRDIERALGLPLGTPGYSIIANASAFANEMAVGHPNVLLIQEDHILDTHELLAHPKTAEYIRTITNPSILVFKNTKIIEKICGAHGWPLLNPSAQLSAQIEEKITQLSFLPALSSFFPDYQVIIGKELEWQQTPIVVQFNHSHTGSGTKLITAESDLNELKNTFPNRPMRVAPYITGPLFTNNNIVVGSNVFVGNMSYQITGLTPFTDNPFATIGNDWAFPYHTLSETERQAYHKIATTVGAELARHGWRGLFGIDAILDSATRQWRLLEINARQPASTVYESQLQMNTRTQTPSDNVTSFEAHILGLLGIETTTSLVPIQHGAQIIFRNRPSHQFRDALGLISALQAANIFVLPYENTTPGSDRLRMQLPTTLMADHNLLNEDGKMIIDHINSQFA